MYRREPKALVLCKLHTPWGLSLCSTNTPWAPNLIKVLFAATKYLDSCTFCFESLKCLSLLSLTLQNTSTLFSWSFSWSFTPSDSLSVQSLISIYYFVNASPMPDSKASVFLGDGEGGGVRPLGVEHPEHGRYASTSSGSSASHFMLNKQFRVSWVIQLRMSTLSTFSSSLWRWRQESPWKKTYLPLGYISTLGRLGLETNVAFPRMCIYIF